MDKQKRPMWQWVLAGVGVFYIVGAVLWGIYAVAFRDRLSEFQEMGPPPERQDMAGRFQKELGLSDAQAAQVAEIMKQNRPMGRPSGAGGGDARAALRAELEKVLSAEQMTRIDGMRGPGGGPGGRGGPPGLSEERITALKEKMTDEQRVRFEKKLKDGPPMGGPPPGGGGPGGPPPQQ